MVINSNFFLSEGQYFVLANRLKRTLDKMLTATDTSQLEDRGPSLVYTLHKLFQKTITDLPNSQTLEAPSARRNTNVIPIRTSNILLELLNQLDLLYESQLRWEIAKTCSFIFELMKEQIVDKKLPIPKRLGERMKDRIHNAIEATGKMEVMTRYQLKYIDMCWNVLLEPQPVSLKKIATYSSNIIRSQRSKRYHDRFSQVKKVRDIARAVMAGDRNTKAFFNMRLPRKWRENKYFLFSIIDGIRMVLGSLKGKKVELSKFLDKPPLQTLPSLSDLAAWGDITRKQLNGRDAWKVRLFACNTTYEILQRMEVEDENAFKALFKILWVRLIREKNLKVLQFLHSVYDRILHSDFYKNIDKKTELEIARAGLEARKRVAIFLTGFPIPEKFILLRQLMQKNRIRLILANISFDEALSAASKKEEKIFARRESEFKGIARKFDQCCSELAELEKKRKQLFKRLSERGTRLQSGNPYFSIGDDTRSDLKKIEEKILSLEKRKYIYAEEIRDANKLHLGQIASALRWLTITKNQKSITGILSDLKTYYVKKYKFLLYEIILTNIGYPIEEISFPQLRLVENTRADLRGGFLEGRKSKKGLDLAGVHIDEAHFSDDHISVENLFGLTASKNNKNIRSVLMLADPGMGKSTFCQKLAYDWGRKKLWADKFDAIYVLYLRELVGKVPRGADDEWLADTIARYCLRNAGHSVIVAEQLKKNSDKVLVIFDGYDEASVRVKKRVIDILQNQKNLHIILTSRPEVELTHQYGFDRVVRNVGLNDKQVELFSKNFLKFSYNKRGDGLHNAFRNNPHLFTLAHAPLHLAMFCAIWQVNNQSLPETLTQLIQLLVERHHQRNMLRKGRDPDDEIVFKTTGVYSVLGKIALAGLENKQLSMGDSYLKEILMETDISLEELYSTGLFVHTQGGKSSFIHLSFQEYMAAYLISKRPESEQEKFVKEHVSVPHFRLVTQMLAGLVGKPIFQWIGGAKLENSSKLKLLVVCLNEHQMLLDDSGLIEMVTKLHSKTGYPILNWAVKKKLTIVVDWLIKKLKVNVNAKDKDGEYPVHLAIKSGSFDSARRLIELQKTDLNVKNRHGQTPLHLAVLFGNIRLVGRQDKVSLPNGRKNMRVLSYSNMVSGQDLSSMMMQVWRMYGVRGLYRLNKMEVNWSVQSRSVDLVKVLISKQRSDVNARDKKGVTPLHLAAMSGCLDLVKVFASDKKTDFTVRDRAGNAPLHFACSSGKLEMVKFLVTHKADPSAKDEGGSTPLHFAAASGNLELVEWLVKEQNANVRAKAKNGVRPLHLAARSGNLEMVKFLVTLKADPNAKDEGGSTPLHFAAASGNLELVEWLVKEQDANVRAKGKNGTSPLQLAAVSGNLEMVKFLVTHKADPSAKDECGSTPLHFAAVSGNLEMVKFLVTLKADPNAKDEGGSTPLHFAAASGNLELVEWLVTEQKVDVSVKTTRGVSVLHLAAASGNSELVKFLVKHKADPNAKDEDDETPLHFAAVSGNLEMIKFLVAHKADPNAKGKKGKTPLHVAAKSGSLEVVKWLVTEQNANVRAKDGDDETPLHLAARSGNLEMVKFLVTEAKANANAKNIRGETPLHLAARSEHLGQVKFLVTEAKANVNAKNIREETPLHLAARSGNLELVKFLVAHKADPNAKGKKGKTPLHVAAKSGSLEVVKWLVTEQKVDVSVKTTSGVSALHLAAKSGDLELVKLLVKHEADPNAKDEDGGTPLHLAARYGNLVVFKWLIEAGINQTIKDNQGQLAADLLNKGNQS